MNRDECIKEIEHIRNLACGALERLVEFRKFEPDLSSMNYDINENGYRHRIEALTYLISLAEKDKEAIELLEEISKKGEEMLTICTKENFVFDNLGDRWQKLAFTFYSEIVQMSSEAHAICACLKGEENERMSRM